MIPTNQHMKDQITQTGETEELNVGEKERVASALAGGLLLSSALGEVGS